MNRLLLAVCPVLVAISFLPSGPAHTQSAPWGCEVLLCSAASNPSWRSIDTCLPPMHRLIREMGRPGFSWPICPGAGTGRPGYEPYEECPEGWTAASDPSSDQPGSGNSFCMRRVNICGGNFQHRQDCNRVEYQPRPVRQDPYYFDISDQTTGGTSRHWFNLRR